MSHIGKFTTARVLAQTLHCERSGEDACGQCAPCRQIEAETHPDYQVMTPDGNTLKIDQIREVKDWLHLRAVSGKHRILIMTEAERMTLEAANAFLKILEEPPPGTLLMLLTESPRQLLETIVSRCQIIRFQPLGREHIIRILRQRNQTTLTPEQIGFLADFGMGQVRGDWLDSLETVQDLRTSLLEALLTLSDTTTGEVLRKVNQWADSKENQWELMLDFLEYWFRDCAWLLHELPQDQLMNRDYSAQLHTCLRRYSPQTVLACHRLVAATRENILMNANKLLAAESLWIQLKHLME